MFMYIYTIAMSDPAKQASFNNVALVSPLVRDNALVSPSDRVLTYAGIR